MRNIAILENGIFKMTFQYGTKIKKQVLEARIHLKGYSVKKDVLGGRGPPEERCVVL